MRSKGIHVVQISLDDSVFLPDADSDTLIRQEGYARALQTNRPNSRLTFLAVTRIESFKPFFSNSLEVIPILHRRFLLGISLWLRLLRLHQSNPIQVLACQEATKTGLFVLLFGLVFRIPVIGQVFNDLSENALEDLLGKYWKLHPEWLAFRFLVRFYSAIRTVTPDARKVLRKLGYEKEIYVIHLPTTLVSHLLPPKSVQQEKWILFVGRLVKQKDPLLWLEVAQLIASKEPRARFRILGEGPQNLQMRSYSKRLGISQLVQFLGAVPYAKISTHFREASLLLLTSKYEGFPARVIVEALAHEVPVVSTKITEMDWGEEKGVLLASRKVKELASMCVDLLNDPLRLENTGKAGRRWVLSQYDPKALSDLWVRLWLKIADEHQAQISRRSLIFAKLFSIRNLSSILVCKFLPNFKRSSS